jgi:DNA-binding response OmpR family regulator
MKLLLVEHELKVIKTLSQTLRENGYLIDHAADGQIGFEMVISGGAYDLIILNHMIPGRDGISVIKEIRSQGFDTPILLISNKDTPQDRVDGLDSGADDYLSQPFLMDELLARLRALSRRRGREFIGNTITAGGLTLDPLKCEVTQNNEVIRLSVKEALLLEILMRNLGRVITKELIFERVWGYESDIQFANIDLYIHYLRKKLNTSYIKTARGIGYYLEEHEES